MSHARIRALVAAALLAGTLATTSAPAGAGGLGNTLVTEPTFNRAEPEFTFAPEGEPSCTGQSVTLTGPDGDLDPEGLVTFDTPLSGTFAPGADAPTGFYQLTIDCQNGEFPETWDAGFAFARLTVDKVVDGTAPAGTTFVIEADCSGDYDDSFTQELEFPAAGGSQPVIVYGPTVCTTSETDDGGADSVAVEGGEADFIESPDDLTTTVTNTFEAPQPEPEPEPEPTPAVQPVQAEPNFTG